MVQFEKEIGKIYETKDYDQFTFLPGNRVVDRAHVTSLKLKMKGDYLMSPINVDSKMRIQDGQHRFTAARELGLPIRYFIGKSMSSTQIAQMNSINKKWSNDNYADSYADAGDQNYQLYKAFRLQFPGIPHGICLILLQNESARSSVTERAFREGTFAVHNHPKAIKTATLLTKLEPHAEHVFKRQNFLLAMLQIMDEVVDFDMDRMIRKLKHKGQSIREFAQKEDFLLALEKVYNWMEPEGNKVVFPRKL